MKKTSYIFLIVFLLCACKSDSGEYTGIPLNMAQNISFTDENLDISAVSGNIIIIKAADESDITHYALYWGYSPDEKFEHISDFEKTGSDITYPIDSALPEYALYFLVFTKNEFGEMEQGKSFEIADEYAPYRIVIDAGASTYFVDINLYYTLDGVSGRLKRYDLSTWNHKLYAYNNYSISLDLEWSLGGGGCFCGSLYHTIEGSVTVNEYDQNERSDSGSCCNEASLSLYVSNE